MILDAETFAAEDNVRRELAESLHDSKTDVRSYGQLGYPYADMECCLTPGSRCRRESLSTQGERVEPFP